jgi:hypothetical protein
MNGLSICNRCKNLSMWIIENISSTLTKEIIMCICNEKLTGDVCKPIFTHDHLILRTCPYFKKIPRRKNNGTINL